MAKAIIEGLLRAKTCSPSQFYISHPSASKTKKFAYLGIENETSSNEDVVSNCDIIVLCVKPQILESVCNKLRHLISSERHLVVSIVAGIKLSKIAELCEHESSKLPNRIARCVINTAALVASSPTVFSHNGHLTVKDKEHVEMLLSSVGACLGEVKDSEMDAAMAVSSCGIAYMFMMADAMADAGVKMGLSRDMSLKLSMQTMKGAGELMISEHGKKHPMQLKDEVCSPGSYIHLKLYFK